MANSIQKTGNDLIKVLNDFFKQAPQLPKGGQDALVTIMPWIALIFGILGVVVGIGAVGISPLALFAGLNASTTVLITGILTIVSSVLMLMAFPKLQKRVEAGWVLLFWSEIVNVVSNLVSINIVGALIGGLIGFYILFQIKAHYK